MNYKFSWLLAAALTALPAAAEEPIITLHSNIYETYGTSNSFTIVVGGTEGEYIDIESGSSLREVELVASGFDDDAQELTGASVSCSVGKDGMLRIYGDPAHIDYLDLSGCYISWIEFADPSNIAILNLGHNEFERLDLSDFTGLQALYLNDNTCFTTPLVIGPNKPELQILEMTIINSVDPTFNISDYPKLISFDAYANPSITQCDPSGCPYLLRLGLDCTNVRTLDVSHNENLMILNVSETGINTLDLSNNPYLQELYITHDSDHYNKGVKFAQLDITNNPKLKYLFAKGNALETIDLSNNVALDHLWLQHNRLSQIDISNCPDIVSLRLEGNYFDFATLPADRDEFIEYEYKQQPFAMPKSVLIDTEIDLSAKVLREGHDTYCQPFYVSVSDPGNPVALDETDYTFDNGKITFHKAFADSVYVEFANTAFTAASLTTANFMVKDASTYGANDLMMSFLPANEQQVSFGVGMVGASPETPKTFYVSFDGGDAVPFTTTTVGFPDEPNATGNAITSAYVKVYVPEGEIISAVSCKGIPMSSCDVTAMKELRQLQINDAGLNNIDLQWNRCLQSLELTGNHFTTFSLAPANEYFGKNVLTRMVLSGNEMATFDLINIEGLHHVDLSNNLLSSLNFTDGDNIEYIDLSHNQFEYLKINYCGNLQYLDVSHNLLTEFVEPETYVVKTAKFDHNCFSMTTLPARHGLDEDHYTYAPQADILITAKAPGVDLTDQFVTIDGESTVYTLLTSDNTALTPDVDYTITDGRIHFLNTETGKIVIHMTHAALPAFTGDNVLKTTEIEPAEMPTNVFAEFLPSASGEVELRLTSNDRKETVFVDWNGDGSAVEQIDLTNSTFTSYTGKAKKEIPVKFYTYDETDNLKVFSVTAPMTSFTPYGLKNLTMFALYDSGLQSLTLPEAEALTELSITGSELSSINFARYPALAHLVISDNKFTSLDLSVAPNLATVFAANNQINQIHFGDLPHLWSLDLSNNAIEDIDLSTVPNISQMSLMANRLSAIDISNQADLRVLMLDGNKLKFSTLPRKTDLLAVYTYAQQDALDVAPDENGRVDLSSEAYVGDTPTVFRWFVDLPTLDDDGELQGEELYPDDEFFVDNGINTFSIDLDNVMCVMTNDEFPNMYQYTKLMNVVDGLVTIPVDQTDAAAVYYNLRGIRVATPAPGEVYIVRRGNTITKEIIR